MASSHEELEKRIAELTKSAEAGAALISTAVLNNWLQKLLLTAMREISNNIAKDIFDSYGPLYELRPKIDLAYAFSIIDDKTFSTLKTLTNIRNKFAHTEIPITFDTPEIAFLCQNLPGWTHGANNWQLFRQAVFDCGDYLDEKINKLVFAKAMPPDA
jgi:DNA-binding MltR family transcriptional regulator